MSSKKCSKMPPSSVLSNSPVECDKSLRGAILTMGGNELIHKAFARPIQPSPSGSRSRMSSVIRWSHDRQFGSTTAGHADRSRATRRHSPVSDERRLRSGRASLHASPARGDLRISLWRTAWVAAVGRCIAERAAYAPCMRQCSARSGPALYRMRSS